MDGFSGYKYNFIPISRNLTEFEKNLLNLEQVRYIENPDSFFKETAYLKKVDGKLSYYYLFSQIKSNDFNEGSGYLTHGIDFYRGSFHGQMVRGLINSCNLKSNSVILDPFCGSGTTLIEAKTLDFNSIGIDINPIACLSSVIKTQLLNLPLAVLSTKNEKYFDLSYYEKFFPLRIEFNELLSSEIIEIFYLFLYLRALALENRLNLKREYGFIKTYKNVINTLSKFKKIKDDIRISFGEAYVVFEDNLNYLKKMDSNSVDAIITSPPYIDLIDYIEEDIYQIKKLFNIDQVFQLKGKSIGNKYNNPKETLTLYWNKIDKVLKELFRILKSNKNFILIIGNYYDLLDKYIELLVKNGFTIKRILPRKISNIKRKYNIEYVLFLEKKLIN